MHHKPPLPTRTLTTAKSLRTASTAAEIKLWYHLRARRLVGLKFRRQHPIPPYIADFYCEELKLVVEVDGSQHDEETDGIRTHSLERQGLVVLRFWDNQVLQETAAVLEAILDFARGRTLSPTPPPEGEGL
ncbi:endonuclease domain-containing protein [Rhodanobacter lindaniclasticus]|uniref:DNA methylase n=1 Tax=Rhodanobacter lindaniclasticus TaxID=75310 RepID=A0A4S3KM16_9GAMM|nr:endonuclease domain-containing protein [Rhodanobacter lindaniclasticus]THD09922.1 DNA methylase [Rhodanobacter lindaniclasticus]